MYVFSLIRGIFAHGMYLFNLLDAKLRKFNPRCAEAESVLLGQFRHLQPTAATGRAQKVRSIFRNMLRLRINKIVVSLLIAT
jgi:hypothetical protein